jgi:hypothetical protein
VGDGHRATFGKQQHRHRLADDIGSADDNRILAAEVAELSAEQLEAPQRCAWDKAMKPDRQPPGIDGVEAVDILVRIDAGNDVVAVDVGGQGQLYE